MLQLLLVLILGTIALGNFASNAHGQLITNIAQMGNTDFTVDEDSTTLSYTQNASAIVINTGFPLGATIGGIWNPATPKDWSLYDLNNFGIIISVSGENPNTPFTIDFYDSSLAIANTFTGTTFGAGATPSFSALTFTTPGTGAMNDIYGMVLTFDAPDTINMSWEGVAVVPEPTTNALLISAAFLGALGLWLRAKKTKKSRN